jgi:hypothetical protein
LLSAYSIAVLKSFNPYQIYSKEKGEKKILVQLPTWRSLGQDCLNHVCLAIPAQADFSLRVELGTVRLSDL